MPKHDSKKHVTYKFMSKSGNFFVYIFLPILVLYRIHSLYNMCVLLLSGCVASLQTPFAIRNAGQVRVRINCLGQLEADKLMSHSDS